MKQDHKVLDYPIEGNIYRIRRMNAMDQFHVTRRLAPMLASMGITATQLKGFGTGKVDPNELMQLVGPAMGSMAVMDNDTVQFIINTCLTAVEREVTEGRFSPVMVNERFMYEDIDMLVMLQLTFEVCRFNLAGFMKGLSGLLSSLSPSAPKEPSQPSA